MSLSVLLYSRVKVWKKLNKYLVILEKETEEEEISVKLMVTLFGDCVSDNDEAVLVTLN